MNTTEKVEELAMALSKRMRTLDDRERIEQEGLQLIRSYRMQLHFKAVFAKAVEVLQLPPARSGSKDKAQRGSSPKAREPWELTREEFLSKMMGKPLAVIAIKSGMNVNDLLQAVQAHGYADMGSRSPLRKHLIPLLLEHLPERIAPESVSRAKASNKGYKDQSSPSKILIARARSSQGQPGNYFKLLYNRSKY
jgi:hypothetical protein